VIFMGEIITGEEEEEESSVEQALNLSLGKYQQYSISWGVPYSLPTSQIFSNPVG
jgi:hypothetical protein